MIVACSTNVFEMGRRVPSSSGEVDYGEHIHHHQEGTQQS